MISIDELSNGKTFILKLWDAAGVPSQWVEVLRGEAARRWCDIYRRSDWAGLRAEAAGVFRNRVTEAEAEGVRKARGRCIYVHTRVVKSEDLQAAAG